MFFSAVFEIHTAADIEIDWRRLVSVILHPVSPWNVMLSFGRWAIIDLYIVPHVVVSIDVDEVGSMGV